MDTQISGENKDPEIDSLCLCMCVREQVCACVNVCVWERDSFLVYD